VNASKKQVDVCARSLDRSENFDHNRAPLMLTDHYNFYLFTFFYFLMAVLTAMRH
jgi:hypothetical protein